jgi:hypothetical protein
VSEERASPRAGSWLCVCFLSVAEASPQRQVTGNNKRQAPIARPRQLGTRGLRPPKKITKTRPAHIAHRYLSAPSVLFSLLGGASSLSLYTQESQNIITSRILLSNKIILLRPTSREFPTFGVCWRMIGKLEYEESRKS